VAYEALWTARSLAQLLNDEVAAVFLEPPDGTGIEFTVERIDESREYHQSKTRADGRWTLANLSRVGVLAAISKRTSDGSDFVFVSSAPVLGEVRDLANLAKKATTLAEYYELLDESDRDLFEDALKRLALVPEAAWRALSHVSFRHGDEGMLREQVEARLTALVDGDPASTIASMVEYSLTATHRRLTSTTVWSELGLVRRSWDRDPHVRTALSYVRDRYLADSAKEVIAGSQLERGEVASLVDRLSDAEGPRRILVAGSAGRGKSVVLAQTVRHLEANGALVLPFRLDQVDLAAQPEVVGRGLGLPGSPTRVLGALAAGDPAVIVIDQLDAVSQVSGRDPQYYTCVETMLRDVDAFPNLRVLLACRDFDLDNDPRLRLLRQRADTTIVQLEGFNNDQVDFVLNELGLRRDQFTQRQQNLLSNPLHLQLLASAPSSSFAGVQDLYQGAWESKRRALRDRAPHWIQIIDALCDAINAGRSLSVPRDALEDWSPEVDAMLSEHVLVETAERRVRFFHEGFFDFAFAKRFAGRGEALVRYLRSTKQDLFHRSQTRQILAYRREVDRERYLRDLADVLGSPDIRFHLKALVVAWLGSPGLDPSADEWAILGELLAEPGDPLTSHIVGLLRGPGWFDIADKLGTVREWLTSADESLVDRAVWVLGSAQRVRGSRVVDLLADRPRNDAAWQSRFRWLVARADLAADERFLDFVLELVEAGALDELTNVIASNGSFWDLGFRLKKQQPEWFPRLAAAYLSRRRALAVAAGVTNPFQDHNWIPDPLDRGLFEEPARAAPAAFIRNLLPFMLSIIEANRRWNEAEQRWDDRVWRWRWVGEAYSVQTGLFFGMETALRALAQTEPSLFVEYADLLESQQSEAADFLLIRAFGDAPALFAERAGRFLIERPVRLHAGYTSDSYWAARELVASIFPYLAQTMRSELEAVILGFYTSWERSKDGHHSYGLGQLTILGGIPDELLSATARARLGELRRKFAHDPQPPSKPEFGFVGPPIERDRARLMTDDQWLKAIAKYDADRDRLKRPIVLSGGARELANLLEEHVRTEPARFARLGLRLPPQSNWLYLDAVLRGLGKSEDDVDRDIVWQLLRRAHDLAGRPAGRSICELIAATAANAAIPAEIVEILAWYATEAPDPPATTESADEAGAVIGPSTADARRRARFDPSGLAGLALLNKGMNSDRGQAALAIAKALRAQPGLLDDLAATIVALIGDPVQAVRACAMECLVAALAIDRERALSWFVTGARADVALAATLPGARLLRYVLRSDARAALDILEALIIHPDAETRRLGAREACLASFATDATLPLATAAMTGDSATRYGAAEVYAANLGDEALGPRCEAPLRELFEDDDEDVRREAGTSFRSLGGAQLTRHLDLFSAFAKSKALTEDAHDVLDAILRIEAPLPDVAGEVGLAILDRAGPAAGDITTAWSAYAPDISAVAVRLNAFGSERGRELALDLFDRLSQVGAYGVDRALDTFER